MGVEARQFLLEMRQVHSIYIGLPTRKVNPSISVSCESLKESCRALVAKETAAFECAIGTENAVKTFEGRLVDFQRVTA